MKASHRQSTTIGLLLPTIKMILFKKNDVDNSSNMFRGQQLFLMSRMLEMSLQAARCEFVLFFVFWGRRAGDGGGGGRACPWTLLVNPLNGSQLLI